MSFAAITLCVASQRVYFVIDSVRKLLDIPLYKRGVFFHGRYGQTAT